MELGRYGSEHAVGRPGRARLGTVYVDPLDRLSERSQLTEHMRLTGSLPDYIEDGCVGRYPAYLCGIIVHAHHTASGQGPKKYATLVLPDGAVLAARCARGFRFQPFGDADDPTVEMFPSDAPDRDNLSAYKYEWQARCGGWAGFSADGADHNDLANSLLNDSVMYAGHIRRQANSYYQRRRTDDLVDGDIVHDVIASSAGAIACVTGIWFDPDTLAKIDHMPSWLRRELRTYPPRRDDPLLGERRASLQDRINPDVFILSEEATAVADISPRAAVGLIRTAAERVLSDLDVTIPPDKKTFSSRIDYLEQHWNANPPTPLAATGDHRPVTSREKARRAGTVAALHTIRDLGNRIHDDAPGTPPDVRRGQDALVELVELVTRQHRLHGD